MASTLFTLLDDIASLLDDIAAMSKTAATKTAGVLGDDLALNAQQVSGVSPERELPVVWAVAKGSLLNKAILVPMALLISAFIPWAIVPLLIIGGAYLCFEGVEKLAHKFLHPHDNEETPLTLEAIADVDHAKYEKDKIRGAIRTDFILSAEIIVIALGTVATEALLKQVLVLSTVAVVMTVGVYGLVGAIVKMDDAGLFLTRRTGKQHALSRSIGRILLLTAPRLLKSLSVVGTLAMFLVGGGILSHNVHALHETVVHAEMAAGTVAGIGPLLQMGVAPVLNVLLGLVIGALVLGMVLGGSKLLRRKH